MLPRPDNRSTRNASAQDSYNAMMDSTRSDPSIQVETNDLPKEVDPEPDFIPSAEARIGSKPPDAPRAGYDEYGAELGPDARIWPAYVKEAEQWDEEMVDGWNRSLDVMLIFTALFSAVSTTFVVESFKSLQPDPSQTSANALVEITQLLRTMSSGSPSTPVSSESYTNPSAFSPSSASIWVNALWFLSLALSVSVSLVVMLAKQWCYSYMSGRSGQPHIQARARHRRLEELQRWKMPEILAFLPTLIHLSLFLFFIGLVINLWDAHIAVAAPVLTTTAITVLFYSLTTVLPVTYELCPYNTPLSQFLKMCPQNLNRLRCFLYSTFKKALRHITHPEIIISHLKARFWLGTSNARRRRQAQEHQHEYKPTNTNSESLMDSLTSRAISWLLVNSQDTRSVDVALQSIAGADHRLPVKPLLECGAHSLVAQKFRASFISHPQSGFSFLMNPNSVDAASLYGRALEFFMKDQKHVEAIELVLRHGPGGGFAIRRAYQCLQFDFARPRPNLAAFSLSGLSAWWSMRSHIGQIPPGVLVDALSMLNRHMSSECALHPAALVALIDTISVEAQYWIHKLAPRERALYPSALLKLLDQLDQVSLGQARPAIATCLSSFSFIFVGNSSASQAPPGNIGPPSSATRFLSYYASSDNRSRDTERLLAYGFLGLLRDREAYELSDIEIGLVARQLRLIYQIKPPPSGVFISCAPPPSDLNIFAIQTLLPILSTSPTVQKAIAPDTRAELLRDLMLYSYMWGNRSNTVYAVIAENLRTPHSASLKLAWDESLAIKWTRYYLVDMLHLINHHRTFESIHELLSQNELQESAVPFAMCHLLSMVGQVEQWTSWNQWSSWNAGPPINVNLVRSVAVQFSNVSTEASATSIAPLGELVRLLSEDWITQLEGLKDRVPVDVLNSGVLNALMANDKLPHLSNRVSDLLDYCTARVSAL